VTSPTASRPHPWPSLPGSGRAAFLLPYEVVRTAAAPDHTLLEFLQSTYEAAANLAHWDRALLERCSSAE
jgi:hypothetical protein